MILAHFLYVPPVDLVKDLLIIMATIFIAHKIAPMFNLTKHGGRAYALLIILIFIGTTDHHAAFPILALLTHLFARKTHPSRNPNRDLEMISVTASVAMIWLFADYILPSASINLFNLTFASVCVIFIGLALGKKLRWLTVSSAVILGGLYIWQASSLTVDTVSIANPYVLPVLSLGLTTSAVVLRPEFFNRFRSLKAYGLSSVFPVLTFIFVGLLSWA